MGYYNEFPHTRGYDGDLGWLIKIYKELLRNYSSILNDYKHVLEEIAGINDNIEGYVTIVVNEALESGTIHLSTTYDEANSRLIFNFKE